MSVDVYLEIDTGGPSPARLTEWRSYPSRVVETLDRAGLNLDELQGKRAEAVERVLREASARPVIRGAAEPRVRMLLNDLIEDCVLHPWATVKVDR